MPVYRFRCDSCGEFEESLPLASASAARDCPDCSARAPRVFAPIGLGRGSSIGMRLADRAGESAHAPAVVSGPPPRAVRRPAADPRTARLPKP